MIFHFRRGGHNALQHYRQQTQQDGLKTQRGHHHQWQQVGSWQSFHQWPEAFICKDIQIIFYNISLCHYVMMLLQRVPEQAGGPGVAGGQEHQLHE